MNLTENEKLLEWSAKNYSEQIKKDFFQDNNNTSYYVKRDNLHCIEEYSWKTVLELNHKLNEVWAENSVMMEVQKTVLVTIMKAHQEKKETNKTSIDEYILPEYVYVF
ncbi:MAG: hypothetical protein IKY94_03300 [Lachnospiraceae bacterium]|nr:hypothetical protein [Lachnospiraceae bacterium]